LAEKFGNAISGLPNFSAKMTVNGKSYTVTFIDGKAYINGVSGGKGGSGSYLDIGEDNRNLNSWGQYEKIDADEMSYYEEIFNQLAGIVSQGDADDFDEGEYDNESGSSSSGRGSGDSGISSGSSSVSMNGDLSGSSGTASASVSGAPSTSAASSPTSPEDAVSMKTLSVDDETFRVIGVGGLVLLIILVIGLYYREDIREMVREE
jgi:hypothetical protein